jgi:hypothetical protein
MVRTGGPGALTSGRNRHISVGPHRTLSPCLDPRRRPTSQELSPGSDSSVLGAIFYIRDQMMVSFTTEARVGFYGREPSARSLAVAAGEAAGGSVASAMSWLEVLRFAELANVTTLSRDFGSPGSRFECPFVYRRRQRTTSNHVSALSGLVASSTALGLRNTSISRSACSTSTRRPRRDGGGEPDRACRDPPPAAASSNNLADPGVVDAASPATANHLS